MVEAGDTFPQGAEITFRAVAEETGDQDTVTNVLPILATTTPETTATVGKTTSSIEESVILSQEIRKNE